MKFNIVDVSNDLVDDGDKIIGHAYAVKLEDGKSTLLDQFLDKFSDDYADDINVMIERLHTMVSETGFRSQFFKDKEGALGDGMVALSENRLRLYGLRFDRTAIFFGSGGYKPENIKGYQEDKALNKEAQLTRKIVSSINQAIKEKDLKINEDGSIEMTDFIDLEI